MSVETAQNLQGPWYCVSEKTWKIENWIEKETDTIHWTFFLQNSNGHMKHRLSTVRTTPIYHYHTAHLISWGRFGKDFLASMTSMCLLRTICPKDPQEMNTSLRQVSLLWLKASKLTLLNKHPKWTIAKFRMSFQTYLGGPSLVPLRLSLTMKKKLGQKSCVSGPRF